MAATVPEQIPAFVQYPEVSWVPEENFLHDNDKLIMAPERLIPKSEASDVASPAVFTGQVV